MPYWEEDRHYVNCRRLGVGGSWASASDVAGRFGKIESIRVAGEVAPDQLFNYLATGDANGTPNQNRISKIWRYLDGYRQVSPANPKYIDPLNNNGILLENHSVYNNRYFINNIDFADILENEGDSGIPSYFADGVYVSLNWKDISNRYNSDWSQTGNGDIYILGKFFHIHEESLYSWWVVFKGQVTNGEIPDFPGLDWQSGSWTYVAHGFVENGDAPENYGIDQS